MNEASKASLNDFLKKNQTAEQPPVAEAPKVEPEKVSQPTEIPTEPRKVEESTVLENWDKASAEAPKTEPAVEPEPYYTQIAKKVGSEFKDEEELIAKLKADPFEGVPANLKKAVELAKKGGDYLQLLKVSQVDYSQIDPVSLYEADVLSKAQDKQAAKEWLDTISPIQKQIGGEQIKQNAIYHQQNQEQELIRSVETAKAQAEQVKKAYNEQAQETLNKTEAIEVAGYKLKLDGRHKKQIANSLASSEFWNDQRYQTQKGFDLERKIRDEFLTTNWETVQQFLSDRVKTATLKEVANEVQNIDLENTKGREQVEQKKSPLFERIKFDQTWGNK
jgi:Enolase